MERLKRLIIRTPLEAPFQWLRLTAKLPWRLRHPELHEIFIEPIRYERALAKMLRPDSNFVDVGAHLGGILSTVLKFAPRGKHIAFEPTPRKANWLRERFPEVEISEVAVSDFSGTAMFFEESNESAVSGLRRHGSAAGTHEFEVTCSPLDDALPKDYLPSVLKVDVIGAEFQVLRGAEQVIARARPIILFASGTEKLSKFGTEPGDMYDWLVERGYGIFLLKDYLSGGNPTDRDRFLVSHEYPYQGFDFIAEHKDN